jgi:hypothetical protein
VLNKRKERFGVYGKKGAYAREQRQKQADLHDGFDAEAEPINKPVRGDNLGGELNQASPPSGISVQLTGVKGTAAITGPQHESFNIMPVDQAAQCLHERSDAEDCRRQECAAPASTHDAQHAKPCLPAPPISAAKPDADWGAWVDYLYRSRLQADIDDAWIWLQQAIEVTATECGVSENKAKYIVDGVLKLAHIRDADPPLLDRLLSEAISKHRSATSGPTGRGV